MNKIEIKDRFNNEVIYSHECENNTLKITCMKAVFDKISLRGADLGGADLYGADLYGADLRGANLRGADLGGADLGGADLGGANLRGADLRGADLGGADLGGADLGGANLRDADLGGANLRDADLRDADLRGAAIVIYGMTWTIQIAKNHIRIGCQSHSLEKWIDFTDDEIDSMHSDALEFWEENKEFIINKCKGLTK